MKNPLRNLPSVHQMLENPMIQQLVDSANHNVVVDGVRDVLDRIRDQVVNASEDFSVPTTSELAEKVVSWIRKSEKPVLRPVINATGVILHTGLGRAPIAASAIEAVSEVSQGYSSLELEMASGQRGQRVRSVSKLLCKLTGAEAAVVVNNNAAATMLTLGALGGGGEVIVSRGQLIEIGGSYRLPDVMQCSGARLREVGTTNKTRLSDYEEAICDETKAIMKVHPSNFAVVGFTKSVEIDELVALGRKNNIPIIDDIGSGALFDFSKYGVHNEPTIPESISAGADVILFSGDKLLGGPQCGIIVGKKRYIDDIMKHPMMRAMRVGKMTLAALWATLKLHRDIDQAELSVPILQLLSTPLENLRLRAQRIAGQINNPLLAQIDAVEDQSMLGGGSLPNERINSWCIAVEPDQEKTKKSLDDLASDLRKNDPPILARVQKGRILLDLRTVFPREDTDVAQALQTLGQSARESHQEPMNDAE